jgi:hypothetical protein
VDTAKATAPKVNASPLTFEDLIHLVDVSVASKSEVDLIQLTRALAEDVRHTLDSYKQDLNNRLSRQIKSVVKGVLGNTQGKRVGEVTSMSVPPMTSPHGRNEAVVENISLGQAAGLNLQQPYYQVGFRIWHGRRPTHRVQPALTRSWEQIG